MKLEEKMNKGKWTKKEQELFYEAVNKYGKNLKLIQEHIGSRSIRQI